MAMKSLLTVAADNWRRTEGGVSIQRARQSIERRSVSVVVVVCAGVVVAL